MGTARVFICRRAVYNVGSTTGGVTRIMVGSQQSFCSLIGTIYKAVGRHYISLCGRGFGVFMFACLDSVGRGFNFRLLFVSC